MICFDCSSCVHWLHSGGQVPGRIQWMCRRSEQVPQYCRWNQPWHPITSPGPPWQVCRTRVAICSRRQANTPTAATGPDSVSSDGLPQHCTQCVSGVCPEHPESEIHRCLPGSQQSGPPSPAGQSGCTIHPGQLSSIRHGTRIPLILQSFPTVLHRVHGVPDSIPS